MIAGMIAGLLLAVIGFSGHVIRFGISIA